MRSFGKGSEPAELPGQEVDAAWLARWLRAFQEQQFEQTRYLRNISTTATILGILIVLSLVAGACSVLMNF